MYTLNIEPASIIRRYIIILIGEVVQLEERIGHLEVVRPKPTKAVNVYSVAYITFTVRRYLTYLSLSLLFCDSQV